MLLWGGGIVDHENVRKVGVKSGAQTSLAERSGHRGVHWHCDPSQSPTQSIPIAGSMSAELFQAACGRCPFLGSFPRACHLSSQRLPEVVVHLLGHEGSVAQRLHLPLLKLVHLELEF